MNLVVNDRSIIDLMLLSRASRYDLSDKAERRRSNKELVDFFYLLQQRLRPAIIFEIGAFGAEFSVEMKRQGFDAIAFEANPYNVRHFLDSGSLTGTGVEYLHMAVGKSTGTIEFKIQRKVGGFDVNPVRQTASTLARTRDNVEYETVEVPCVSLDDFRTQRDMEGNTFSAWIDVEGAAGDVLLGAQASLRSCLTLLIEVEQHKFWKDQWMVWEVMDHLMSSGFLPVARDFEYRHQYNLVFIRRELLENLDIRDALTLYFGRAAATGG